VYFKAFFTESPSQNTPISIPDKLAEKYLHECSSTALTAADEYHLLHLVISNALLPYHRCIFQGTAFLWQGKENTITRLTPQEAVIPIYKQFLYLPEKEEHIRAVCRLEDALLRHIPVWKLVNLGDLDSAQLTHDVLLKYLEDIA